LFTSVLEQNGQFCESSRKALPLDCQVIHSAGIEDLPESQRKRLDGASLGRYIGIANDSGLEFEVPYEDLKRLNHARNDAVHRAQAPDSLETAILLSVAGNFLRSSGRVKGASAPTG
jgi:hypothetical protein